MESTHQSTNPALSLCYTVTYDKPWNQSAQFTMGPQNKPWTVFYPEKRRPTGLREAEPWYRPEFLADLRHGTYYKEFSVSGFILC